MAKVGNKSGVKHIDYKGRCYDCGDTKGPFTTVYRSTLRKGKFIKLCEKCGGFAR
jgi:UTP-glucose-1-phosphate uridylyltransferase